MELVGLAALAYLPPLLSARGRVSADSKQYLYLDPGDFLARAPQLWDAQVGAGGVSHQHIGYLWPMGPWFWLLDLVGVPPWVAQRLWLGTLAFAAALGTRWLLRRLGLSRAGVLAGTLVYLLTPFQLAFTARSSILLLPWAALPWLIGLTDRAQRDGGWRDPAWMALLALTVGSVNASSLVLIGIGPLVWLLMGVADRASARRAAGIAGRTAVLGIGTSLWWIAALRLEAAHGLPVLQVTENLRTVAATSSPSDVLRGLGNWFFYGRDRLGPSIDQSEAYLRDRLTIGATFGLSALGIAAALAVRWRHRARFVALVLVGTVVSVGAWPLDDPSPFARGVAAFSDTSAGLALRNTARAAPVIVLGLAGLLAAATSAWQPGWRRVGAAALVGGVALLGLKPVAETGVLSVHQDRVDPIPEHWEDAAADLEDDGTASRVLLLPGSNFAAHRWGNAVDPILPGLMERGEVGREVLPLGSPSSALLIDALDRRLQEGVLDPAAIAPIARLFGAGDVVVRSDLEYERFRTPNPRSLWELLTGADVPGLTEPDPYGPRTPNRAAAELPMVDEIELRLPPSAEEPPPIARFGVEDPQPIVRTAPVEQSVVVAGDGDGIVDAATAGLIDGRTLVLQATSLSADALEAVLDEGAEVVVTDTYRRRIQTWFYAIRDTRGPTERAGETLEEPTEYDYRIDPTPEVRDERRTVVEHEGGAVTASGSGGASRPEDRAVAAIDGDVRTSWRVGGADPTGAWWRVRLPARVPADEIVLVQPQDGPRDRRIDRVRIRVDGGRPVDVALTEASLTAAGQAVPLSLPQGARDVHIEVTGVTEPPFDPVLANAIGFAEIRLGGVEVREVVRVPTDLLRLAGSRAGADLVLTRLRYEPGERGRQDQERSLERVLDLPHERSFTLTGTARPNANAPDEVLDSVLGTDVEGSRVSASSHLAGDIGSRASRALDGDGDTAWQTAFGPQDRGRLEVELAEPTAVGEVTVEIVDDARHSLPGTITLRIDGQAAVTVTVPDAGDDGRTTVTLPATEGAVRSWGIELGKVEARTAVPDDPSPAEVLPVAITDVQGAGLPVAIDADEVPGRCRNLVVLDDQPVAVRLSGSPHDARRGLALEACAGPLELDAGEHDVATVRGIDRGLDVDQLVLSSTLGGGPGLVAPRGALREDARTDVEVRSTDRGARYDLELETDGQPFWLILGQSDGPGWELDVDGATVGAREIVDGYANGWLVTPDRPGTLEASVRWTPQRLVWLTLPVSLLAVGVCIALIVLDRRRATAPPPPDDPVLVHPAPGRTALSPGAPGLAVAVGVAVLLVATPVAAAVASGAVLVGMAVPQATYAWLVVAPALVVLARSLEQPKLAWVALALLAADLIVDRWQSLSDRRRALARWRARGR